MSYFDDASLVMIPSGYKDQKVYSVKPIDGSGDLTFSRASNASRINSSGLVEKVRENLVLYSEQFDNAAWTKGNLSVSANSIANPIDGATTADTIVEAATTGTHYLYQSPSLTGEFTYSVYAKAKERDHIVIAGSINLTTFYSALFDLTNGLVEQEENGSSNTLNASIVAIGSGWYRCSVTITSASAIPFVIWTSDGSALSPTYYEPSYAGDGTSGVYVFGAQAETGVLTDYIATTSSAVSVGPVSGLPRLDYSGGASCPSLLLEPQRTNDITFSESFDNAAWTKGNATISANTSATLDPSGYNGSDKLQEDSSTNPHYFGHDTVSASSGNSVTFSIFLKAAERNWAAIRLYTGFGSKFGYFNLSTGTLGTVDSGATASIISYGNGWYRCSLTVTMDSSSVTLPYVYTSTGDGVNTYTGTTGSGIYCFGGQQEIGAYATSYIPTLSTAVTRVVDNTLTSGLSGSLPQTAGTLFWDIEYTFGASSTMLMHNTGVSDYAFCQVSAGGLVEGGIYESGTMVERLVKSGAIATGRHKLAFAYETNSFALYVDGVLADSGTSGSTASISMNTISLDWNSTDFTRVNQLLLFQTRLSNADLATLTTI